MRRVENPTVAASVNRAVSVMGIRLMKPFTTVTIVFLAVIALMHVIRMALHWPLVVAGMAVPVWVSAVAAVVTAMLAIMVWRENRR